MTNRKRWNRFILFLCLPVALIFILAGISKILTPTTFAQDIDNYRLLPYLLVTLMAVALPWIELVCGILLISGVGRRGAALLLLLMCVMFLIAIGSAMARGLDITCGCFTMTSNGMKVGYTRLIEDVVLLILIGLINIYLFKTARRQ